MRTALLVCGSRVLGDVKGATVWGRQIVAAAIAALPPRSVVLTGGAVGPDAWAGEFASKRAVNLVEYRLDGFRWVNGKWDYPPWPHRLPIEPHERKGGRGFPLLRNQAMIDALAQLDPEWDRYVLALIAPWAQTQGTQFTVEHARRAGIRVDEHVCR